MSPLDCNHKPGWSRDRPICLRRGKIVIAPLILHICAILPQFFRYILSAGVAVVVHLAVLVVLIELVGSPAILASALGFACAVPVNYTLQHYFVFSRLARHSVYFPRYVIVTMLTMGINTIVFLLLSSGIGIYYLASQVITIGVIVPINFAANRSFTFAPMDPGGVNRLYSGQLFGWQLGVGQPRHFANEWMPPRGVGRVSRSRRTRLPLHPQVRSTAWRAEDLSAIALFDLDGTITRRDTYLAYLLGFLARHPERWPRAALLPLAVLTHLAGWRSNTWLKTTFLRAVLGGLSRRQLESWTDAFLDRVLSGGLRSGALATIERHRAAGHALLLVTASLDFYAEPLGRALGFDTILCTRAQYDATGRVTGDLDGANLYGAEKLAQVQRYLQQHVPGTPVTCYCDHHSDLPLLQFADQAIAINPTRRLRRTAERIGLPIEDWT